MILKVDYFMFMLVAVGRSKSIKDFFVYNKGLSFHSYLDFHVASSDVGPVQVGEELVDFRCYMYF